VHVNKPPNTAFNRRARFGTVLAVLRSRPMRHLASPGPGQDRPQVIHNVMVPMASWDRLTGGGLHLGLSLDPRVKCG
jgi:hypothetical protein